MCILQNFKLLNNTIILAKRTLLCYFNYFCVKALCKKIVTIIPLLLSDLYTKYNHIF